MKKWKELTPGEVMAVQEALYAYSFPGMDEEFVATLKTKVGEALEIKVRN